MPGPYTGAMRVAAATLAVLLTTCAHVAPRPPVEAGVIADRLYCGLSIPGGGAVSEAEVATFVEEVVTPRFPEGFTIWRAEGLWKGGHEPSLVVEILHPYDAALDAKVREIAEEFRKRFHQEAVMRVSVPARIEFVH